MGLLTHPLFLPHRRSLGRGSPRNCRNIRLRRLPQRELSNGVRGVYVERYSRRISLPGWLEGDRSDRPHGTVGPYSDPVSISMSAGDYSCGIIKQDVARLVYFDHVVEFCISEHVDGFFQPSSEMQFQSQIALLHQVEMSALVQIRRQIKRKECESVGVFFTTDVISTIVTHKSRTREQWGVTPRAQFVSKLGSQWFGWNLFSVQM